jgi:hypothetical protein
MIPTIDRTTVIKGPALVTRNQVTYLVSTGIKVTPVKETFQLRSSSIGTYTRRRKNTSIKISYTPDGRIAADLIGDTYGAYATMLPGTSIFGATDTPLYIQTLNNQNLKFTFPCTAQTKIPQFMADPTKTAIGEMEFTAIRGRNVAVTDPNGLVQITASTYSVPSGTVTGATNANPTVITTAAAHLLAVGDKVTISGVGGNTNANGTFTVATVPSATTFTLYQLGTTTPIAGNAAFSANGAFIRANTGDALNNSDVITSPFNSSWATTVPTGTITETSDATPDVITTEAAHGLEVNDKVTIAGVLGDTAVNGTFFVLTTPTAETFTISETQGGAAIAGAGAYTSGGTFTRANVWDSFDTEDGFTLDFQLTLKTKRSSNNGIYDMEFSDLTVTATAKAIGMAESDVLAAMNIQGSNAQIGADDSVGAQNLNLIGTGLYARVYNAAMDEGAFNFDADNNRIDALKWSATRSLVNNALQPLFAISTTPID